MRLLHGVDLSVGAVLDSRFFTRAIVSESDAATDSGGVVVQQGKGNVLLLEVAVFSSPVSTIGRGRSCWYVNAGPGC